MGMSADSKRSWLCLNNHIPEQASNKYLRLGAETPLEFWDNIGAPCHWGRGTGECNGGVRIRVPDMSDSMAGKCEMRRHGSQALLYRNDA